MGLLYLITQFGQDTCLELRSIGLQRFAVLQSKYECALEITNTEPCQSRTLSFCHLLHNMLQ